MKKITYIGLERCDFIYHLATILSLQGNVLINDRSVSLDLIKSVSPYDDLNERVDWRNIVTVKDADTDNSDVSDFEYVIDYVGMNFEEKDFFNNTLTLIMPGFEKYSIKELSEKMPANASNPMFILRDACSKKYTQKSIAALLQVSPKEILGFIPLSATDMGNYIILTHNRAASITNLSPEFIEGLEFVSAKLLEIEGDTRKIKKVFKAAQKIK